MAFLLKEKELADLDKQTLIKMLMAATESNQKLSEATEQILRQHRFGRSSEKGLTSGEDGCSQLCFAFNEAEITINLNPAFPEPELEDIFPETTQTWKKENRKTSGRYSRCSGDCGYPYPVGRRTDYRISGWIKHHVCFYLPSTKSGIIFSQVLAHKQLLVYHVIQADEMLVKVSKNGSKSATKSPE